MNCKNPSCMTDRELIGMWKALVSENGQPKGVIHQHQYEKLIKVKQELIRRGFVKPFGNSFGYYPEDDVSRQIYAFGEVEQ